MGRSNIRFLFLNLGHFYNHLLLMIFATVAALKLASEWHMSYSSLVSYAVPGLVALGLFTIPSGWLADRWSRSGMIAIFFIGSGICAILTGLSNTSLQIGFGLFWLGIFSAIYHPVGLAMVVESRKRVGVSLAVNGIFGNLGVASAALLTGYLIDRFSWQMAFIIPGIISLLTGLAYMAFNAISPVSQMQETATDSLSRRQTAGQIFPDKQMLMRIFSAILIISAIGGLLFQSTTFALPKILEERLSGMVTSATDIGSFTFLVFFVASFAQLLVGFLIDRFSIRLVFSIVVTLQALALFAMQELSGSMALIVSVVLMISVFGQIPIVDTVVARVTRPEWRSRAYAMRNVCSFLAAPLSVSFIAYMHLKWGFAALFLTLSIAAAISFLCLFLIPQSGLTSVATANKPRLEEG